MITLLCIKDLQMRNSSEIAFFKGQTYEFEMCSGGGISRYTYQTGYHSFRADVWGEFFQYQLEKENA